MGTNQDLDNRNLFKQAIKIGIKKKQKQLKTIEIEILELENCDDSLDLIIICSNSCAAELSESPHR